jgi:acyl-CoA thioester hydrolase
MSETFSILEYVRWSDVDAAGIICYGAYVRFVEIAETELFRTAGIPYGKVFERFDCWLPRARFTIDFRRPAVLDERLKVSAGVSHVGNRSITLEFRFDNEREERVADCEIVLVCVDRHSFRPKPLPEGIRTALEPYRSAAAPT